MNYRDLYSDLTLQANSIFTGPAYHLPLAGVDLDNQGIKDLFVVAYLLHGPDSDPLEATSDTILLALEMGLQAMMADLKMLAELPNNNDN